MEKGEVVGDKITCQRSSALSLFKAICGSFDRNILHLRRGRQKQAFLGKSINHAKSQRRKYLERKLTFLGSNTFCRRIFRIIEFQRDLKIVATWEIQVEMKYSDPSITDKCV